MITRWPGRIFYGWWIVAAGFGLEMLIGALLFHAYGAYVVLLREEFGWRGSPGRSDGELRDRLPPARGPRGPGLGILHPCPQAVPPALPGSSTNGHLTLTPALSFKREQALGLGVMPPIP